MENLIPHNLLPIVRPLEDTTQYDETYFYENVVKHLIPDIVQMEANGIPIDLSKVSVLEDKDERGMLFWTTLEIIAHVLKHNPKARFLMENVKMKKDFEQYITHHTEQALGCVEKTLINSALVSAQNRNRYYWTNFKVDQPNNLGLTISDLIDSVGEYEDVMS